MAADAIYSGGDIVTMEGDSAGTIAEGKRADFVILGQNPFKVDPVTIKDVPVVATVLGGKEFPVP